MDCRRAFAAQNVLQLLPEEIPQRQLTLAVETAGDDRPVAEDGQLPPQPVAELHAPQRRARCGPVEFFRVL